MNMPERFWEGKISKEKVPAIREAVLKFNGRRGRVLWVVDGSPPADVVWEGTVSEDTETMDAIVEGVLKHVNEKGTISWVDAR